MGSTLRIPLLAFLGLTAAVILILMLRPLPPDQLVRPAFYGVDLPGPFGLSLSIDSPAFMRLALQPSELLAPNQLRQSRPGIILAAAPLARVLSSIVESPMVAAYSAYLILNVATLALSFFLYLTVVRTPHGRISLPVFLAGLPLLVNNVTVQFLLSPHTSLLNLLAPIACLQMAQHVWRERLFRRPRIFPTAMLAGFGVLAYGSFALAFPVLLLTAAAREKADGQTLGTMFFVRALLLLALMLAPVGVWYALVVAKAGSFYSAEVEVYRSFVWMADLTASSGVRVAVGKLASLTTLSVRHGAVMAAAPLAIVVACLVFVPSRRELWRAIRTDAALSALVYVLFTLFFALSGFAWDRNVYSAIVPFIALAGCTVREAEQLLTTRGARILTCALLLAIVVIAGTALGRIA